VLDTAALSPGVSFVFRVTVWGPACRILRTV
jgi:hypothetical protein